MEHFSFISLMKEVNIRKIIIGELKVFFTLVGQRRWGASLISRKKHTKQKFRVIITNQPLLTIGRLIFIFKKVHIVKLRLIPTIGLCLKVHQHDILDTALYITEKTTVLYLGQ
jgi:hypothetical protein